MSVVEQRAVKNFGLSSGVNKNSRFSRVNIIDALSGVTTDCKMHVLPENPCWISTELGERVNVEPVTSEFEPKQSLTD